MKKNNTLISVFALFILFLSFTVAAAQEFSDVCTSSETVSSLSEALQQKETIQKLDLSMQKMTTLPLEVTQLKNLQCLDLSFNKFRTLPPEFANLKNLTYLNLTGTRYMAKVPAILKQLSNLKILDLRDHPEWSKAVVEEAKKMLPNVQVITQ
ncbi:MAG: leucine-rich repeat domain-containing protein [Cytophagaceae bacterium]|nr:leucine-rich repeat domain-containing protein [Cytophagaceae bacterium]